MTASPLCITRDGFSTFNSFVRDDVVMRSDRKRPKEPPSEEGHKVSWVFVPLGMQQIAK